MNVHAQRSVQHAAGALARDMQATCMEKQPSAQTKTNPHLRRHLAGQGRQALAVALRQLRLRHLRVSTREVDADESLG